MRFVAARAATAVAELNPVTTRLTDEGGEVWRQAVPLVNAFGIPRQLLPPIAR